MFDSSNMKESYKPNYNQKYIDLLQTFDLIGENYSFIPAKVINLSVLRIGDLFLLNKGLNDNVLNNSYVVDQDGLVGVIKKTFNNYAVGQLKSSNNLKIAVEINDCYGTLVNKNNKSYVSDLINCENVKVNDSVFTSKFSISSSNILVGHVKKVENGRIYVKYVSNPYKVKYVGIVYDNN
jgi:cell shape-determining protein MreC